MSGTTSSHGSTVQGTRGPTPDVAEIIGAVDVHPTPASYMRAARALRAGASNLVPLRIAFLSSYTIDLFVPYVVVELARQGFAATVHVGPFHSTLQELLHPASSTVAFKPDLIVIAQLLDDISPILAHDFLAGTGEQHVLASADVVSTLVSAMRAFRERHACPFIVHNFAQPQPMLGLAEATGENTRSRVVRMLNERLADTLRDMSDAFVLDFDFVSATTGYARSRDTRNWYMAHAPLSTAVSQPLAREHARIVRALKGTPRKCLVVDLDNTLWGGIVGEDGVAGIQIGAGYPGNVFLDFQRLLLQLHQQGVLLAINSKNNEADVLEAFRLRSEMVLNLHHFAAIRINWQDKAANMESIAAELNIGINSLVFFDDNPVERARMQQALPEVLTLDVSANPLEYLDVMQAARPFDRLHVTEEDRRRGSMYQAEKQRVSAEASSASVEDFLLGLAMRVDVQDVGASDIPRVVDLLRKTNQFNVTTRRHSAADLDHMRNSGTVGAFALRAADRYGDHGLVGLAIVRLDDAVATIDSFLLSCRVIGRGVEGALLTHLAEWADDAGATTLEGEFIPTAKNTPAAGFFETHGFQQTTSTARETANAMGETASPYSGSRWTLDLVSSMPEWPAHIAREQTPATSSDTPRETMLASAAPR